MLHVYTFHHWDAGHQGYPAAPATIETARIAAAFRRFGWEGDGTIRVVELPPFCLKTSDTVSQSVFHVKQSNNGTSWIASCTPLHSADCDLVGTVDAEALLPKGG